MSQLESSTLAPSDAVACGDKCDGDNSGFGALFGVSTNDLSWAKGLFADSEGLTHWFLKRISQSWQLEVNLIDGYTAHVFERFRRSMVTFDEVYGCT